MLASPRGSIGGQEERSSGERNGDALECRLCIFKKLIYFSPVEDAKILAKNKMTIKRSYSIEVKNFYIKSTSDPLWFDSRVMPIRPTSRCFFYFSPYSLFYFYIL